MAQQKKPEDIEAYKKWLEDTQSVRIGFEIENYYKTVTKKIKNDFENSEFWIQLTKNLSEFNIEYEIKNGYKLLLSPNERHEIYIKPYNSFLNKTFRQNIFNNERWPECPIKGWILPNNWYERINDIIRTSFAVKYLDGVEFLIKKIKNLCKDFDTKCESTYLESMEGYYAAHVYIMKSFEIPPFKLETKLINLKIEIQITTQLQDVIRTLLHKHYEKRRIKTKKEKLKWQWDYTSNEFATNYLGHILHYIEGMIMDIRERMSKEDKIERRI